MSLDTGGSYTIAAQTDSLGVTQTSAFPVFGEATKLGISSISPTSIRFGNLVTFTVTWTIRDRGGNVVSDDSSTPVTIVFHENSTGATLTIGTSNPRTTIGGQGIFSSGGSGYVGGYVPGFTPSVSLAADMAKTIRESLLNVLAQTFYNDLSLGAQGDDVKYLQLFLITKNTGPQARVLKTFGITPFFGPVTEAALKEFQKANNVPATGYFGPKTRAAAKGQ